MNIPFTGNGKNGTNGANGKNGTNGTNGYHRSPEIVLELTPDVGPSDGNNGKYHRPPAQYDDPAWHLGWTDGRVGQPVETHEEVLLAQAKVDWQSELRKTRGELAGARARTEALAKKLEVSKEMLGLVRDSYLALFKKRNENSSGSSLLLATLYLGFGLVLFLADVPLSLSMVARGFKIPIAKNDIFTNQRVEVGMILADPWMVMRNLWDAVFLALGIAFMGIIVKFFVDEFILREADDPPWRWGKRVGILAAFGLFVASTVYLGLYRSEIFKQISSNHQSAPSETVTFILLTLTFPIAGGLCFSAGWRRLERAKHYLLTLLRLELLQWRHSSLTAKHSQSLEQVRSLEYALEHEGDALAVSRADLRRNIYRHGYNRGRNVPETLDAAETLYDRCERTLTRVLARKVQEKLRRDS